MGSHMSSSEDIIPGKAVYKADGFRMSKLMGFVPFYWFQLSVYDWDSDGSHDFIGGCSTTLENMLRASAQEVRC